VADLTERRREVPLDLRVQRALVVAEAGLDLAADVVDDWIRTSRSPTATR
jgi:hypothetical protein